MPQVLAFGGFAVLVTVAALWAKQQWNARFGLVVTPYEVAGGALGLLLVLRTNAGYDRWWEARKLWGGIVNQSRNLAAGVMAYGPPDPAWRKEILAWVAAFPHLTRLNLRSEKPDTSIEDLLGTETARRLSSVDHMPLHAAVTLGSLLHHARESGGLDSYAFLQLDKERATLIDHLGACERILRTPLPQVLTIKLRRSLTWFLLALPLALVHKIGIDFFWVPVVTMLASYAVLSLDQIGEELQNPFSRTRLGHLPLDDICATIQRNVLALLQPPKP
jgi:putative membrane protein